MTFGLKLLGRAWRKFRASEGGGPTVEFVLVFPPMFILAISGFELGLLMTRHVMLERGVDMAVREVRLNTNTMFSETDFKKMVCNAAGIIPECMTRLRIEMRTANLFVSNSVSATNIPRQASCLDIANPFQPASTFDNGLPNQMMVVRACGLFVPMLPETALGWFLSGNVQLDDGTSQKQGDGFYRLVSTSAFVMEPL